MGTLNFPGLKGGLTDQSSLFSSSTVNLETQRRSTASPRPQGQFSSKARRRPFFFPTSFWHTHFGPFSTREWPRDASLGEAEILLVPRVSDTASAPPATRCTPTPQWLQRLPPDKG